MAEEEGSDERNSKTVLLVNRAELAGGRVSYYISARAVIESIMSCPVNRENIL